MLKLGLNQKKIIPEKLKFRVSKKSKKKAAVQAKVLTQQETKKLAEKLLAVLPSGDILKVGDSASKKGVKYKVVTKLGEGSFGGVFQVSVGGYDFAVKQFNEERAELEKRPEFVQNSDFFQTFCSKQSF